VGTSNGPRQVRDLVHPDNGKRFAWLMGKKKDRLKSSKKKEGKRVTESPVQETSGPSMSSRELGGGEAVT